ncbi:MAG: hypothetical protein MJ086_04095 [Lachnospiraceae bacterium]|nr:hypothetical protein [Lachnospiraceae bacterium]
MKLKHWIRIIIFAGLSIGLIALASFVMCVAYERDTVGMYGYYKEPDDSISVALIGPSTIYTSFYSPLAYEKYGFTSFNLSTSDMMGASYKSAVQLAESNQKPDLYVVETWGFTYKDQLEPVHLRRWIDAMKDSELRTQTIEELIPEEEWYHYKHPFIKYHSRWDDIGGCLKVFIDKLQQNRKGYSVTKNFYTYTDVNEYKEKKSKYKISEEGFKYLDIFLNYCKENGIENILFIRSPESITYEMDESYYEMLDIIEEAGYDFLDMQAASSEIGMDLNHDFYNPGHLNIFGAQKYTDYLSKYIVEHYDINTDYAPEVVKEWDDCASYNKKIFERLERLTDKKTNESLYIQRDFY